MQATQVVYISVWKDKITKTNTDLRDYNSVRPNRRTTEPSRTETGIGSVRFGSVDFTELLNLPNLPNLPKLTETTEPTETYRNNRYLPNLPNLAETTDTYRNLLHKVDFHIEIVFLCQSEIHLYLIKLLNTHAKAVYQPKLPNRNRYRFGSAQV